MAWGLPRATMDVDALVAFREDDVARFTSAVRDEGFSVDERDLLDVLHEGGHVTVFDDASSFHVDVKLARTQDELEEVDAATEVAMGEGRIRVASPEDTVAFKLLYGTPQDLQDARSILDRQRDTLDREKIRRLAARLGVLDAWVGLEDEMRETGPGRVS